MRPPQRRYRYASGSLGVQLNSAGYMIIAGPSVLVIVIRCKKLRGSAFLPPQLHRYDNSVWQNYSAAYSILVFAVLLRGRLGEHVGYAAATLSGHRVNGYPRILRLPSLMNSKDEIYKNPDPVWRRSNSPSQNSYREKTGSLPLNIPPG